MSISMIISMSNKVYENFLVKKKIVEAYSYVLIKPIFSSFIFSCQKRQLFLCLQILVSNSSQLYKTKTNDH